MTEATKDWRATIEFSLHLALSSPWAVLRFHHYGFYYHQYRMLLVSYIYIYIACHVEQLIWFVLLFVLVLSVFRCLSSIFYSAPPSRRTVVFHGSDFMTTTA